MAEILRINHGDEYYPKTLAFRQKILRDPLGMTYNDAELARDREITYFIYVDKSEVHGCVGFVEEGESTARLLQMAVDDRLQGQGVGRQLVIALEEYAKSLKLKTIILDARYNARLFYAKLGYEEYGEIYDKISLKHIDMKKTL